MSESLFTKLTEEQMDSLFDHAARLQTAAEKATNANEAAMYALRSLAATNMIVAHMLRAELVSCKGGCEHAEVLTD